MQVGHNQLDLQPLPALDDRSEAQRCQRLEGGAQAAQCPLGTRAFGDQSRGPWAAPGRSPPRSRPRTPPARLHRYGVHRPRRPPPPVPGPARPEEPREQLNVRFVVGKGKGGARFEDSKTAESGRLLCASLRSRKLRSRKERSRKEKVKEGKVKEVLCRSGAARASSSAAFPKQQLGERSRIVVAAQFALAHPRGVAAVASFVLPQGGERAACAGRFGQPGIVWRCHPGRGALRWGWILTGLPVATMKMPMWQNVGFISLNEMF